MAKMAKVKARISGNVVEFWEYEKPIFLEGNNAGGRRKADEPKSEKAAEHKKSNSRKSKDKFMALVRTNFEDGDKFITLTFRDTDAFNIRDVKDTNKEFKKFMQRLKYKFGDFKYIAVIEFQDENKRGAVHYHFMAKLPFVKFDQLAEIWGHGFIGINMMKGVDNIGAYISKYMQKDMGDVRLEGKKNYLPSKNLEKPMEIYGKAAADLLQSYQGIKKEAFRDCYDSEHFGNINYKEYNLKRENAQTKKGYNLIQKEIERAQKEKIDSLIYEDYETLTDGANRVMEGLEDGSIKSGTILEAIEKRERKSLERGRAWLNKVAPVVEVDAKKRKEGKRVNVGRTEKVEDGEQLKIDWVALKK